MPTCVYTYIGSLGFALSLLCLRSSAFVLLITLVIRPEGPVGFI